MGIEAGNSVERTLTIDESSIYGSSRLGTVQREQWIARTTYDLTTGTPVPVSYTTFIPDEYIKDLFRGDKNYELSNHLGNVLAVVSDRRTPEFTGGILSNYNAYVNSAQDYYSFGMTHPGRSFGSTTYKYGFNGKEKDDEWTGNTGATYDFGARIYDSRIGRWLACDPFAAKYSGYSPYNYVANSPLIAIDPFGETIKIVTDGDWDSKAFIEVAATNKGGSNLRSLIVTPRIFKAQEVGSLGDVNYNDNISTICYSNRTSPYLSTRDIWSMSGSVLFGHEMSHSLDDLNSILYSYKNGQKVYNNYSTEQRAGDFQNYISSVYNMSFYRNEYLKNGNVLVNYNTDEKYVNSNNEKITDMELLGKSSSEQTDMFGGLIIEIPSYKMNKNQMVAVSYNLSTTGSKGTTSTTKMYMLTWMNDKGEVDFFKTSDKSAFDKKTQSMQGSYSVATEQKYYPGIK